MGPHETFYAIDKAHRLVGFDPVDTWRNELDAPG